MHYDHIPGHGKGMVDCLEIEQAALRAWPAVEEIRIGPWLLRFADHYTKRANSATFLPTLPGPHTAGLDECERFYMQRGGTPCFRLLSFAGPDVDDVLAHRGYQVLEPTLVMYLDLSAFPVQETTEIVETEEVASWLQVYHEFRGAERPLHPAHGDIVARIRSPVLPAVLRREGRIVSCGLGVLDGEYFGIFDMVTEPASRKLGHARSLISDMLSWAKSQGARMAYLQVVEENHAAVHLYRRLGFRDLYCYWYRVAD